MLSPKSQTKPVENGNLDSSKITNGKNSGKSPHKTYISASKKHHDSNCKSI